MLLHNLCTNANDVATTETEQSDSKRYGFTSTPGDAAGTSIRRTTSKLCHSGSATVTPTRPASLKANEWQ